MAVRFDATTDRLSRTTTLPVSTTATMMAWVYLSVDANVPSSILSLGESGGNTWVYHTNATATALELWNGSSNLGTGQSLVLNVWAHMAVTCSGTAAGTLIPYLNGIAGTAHAGLSVTSTIMTAGNNGQSDEVFNGRMAAIKVYSAVLTANEIAREMRSYMPRRTLNLNTFCPCVHPTAASNGADFSGVGGNMTVNGTLVVEDGPPIMWAPRKTFPWHAPVVVSGGPKINSLMMAGIGR